MKIDTPAIAPLQEFGEPISLRVIHDDDPIRREMIECDSNKLLTQMAINHNHIECYRAGLGNQFLYRLDASRFPVNRHMVDLDIRRGS